MTFKVLKVFHRHSILLEQFAAIHLSRSLSTTYGKNNFTKSRINITKPTVTKSKWRMFALASGSAIIGYCMYKNKDEIIQKFSNSSVAAKAENIYSSAEVAKHSTKATGVWVSYKDGVYDISDFVEVHPGGDKIMLGAGGPIDAYWNLYAVHQTPEVLEILESYKIGKLKPDDIKPVDLNDPFAEEPSRLPVFRINSKKPFNAEPPLEVLTDSFITPNEFFYVRNHLPVPKINPEKFKLEIVVGNKILSLSLDDLKCKYKPVTITTTIQCAGNRRSEMSGYKSVSGLTWGTCAIGTARWTGVRLRDILTEAGFNVKDKRFNHIQFNGKDVDITKSSYGASIPKWKAMSDDGDVIIAYKMNGVDIPRDHGYPLRAIVPGYVGARNVKWLHQVVASHEESRSHWQRKDYKAFSPSTTFETADYEKAQAIQDMPVVSAISTPRANSIIYPFDGTIEVKGYAWSGGGRDIIRVDVSADGGETWKEAKLMKDQPNSDDSSHSWAWTLWTIDLPVEEGKKHEIICKAVDSAYNMQPENIAPIWNLRGFLTTCWHRVPITVSSNN